MLWFNVWDPVALLHKRLNLWRRTAPCWEISISIISCIPCHATQVATGKVYKKCLTWGNIPSKVIHFALQPVCHLSQLRLMSWQEQPLLQFLTDDWCKFRMESFALSTIASSVILTNRVMTSNSNVIFFMNQKEPCGDFMTSEFWLASTLVHCRCIFKNTQENSHISLFWQKQQSQDSFVHPEN